jgi:hypothetical protein
MKNKTHLLKFWINGGFHTYCGKDIDKYEPNTFVTDEDHIEELTCESCKKAIRKIVSRIK